MTKRKDPLEDLAEGYLVREFAPKKEADGPCPSAGLLAGFAEGRLLSEERTHVEQHVAECECCRALVGDLVGELPAATRTRWPWWAMAAAAAATILAAVFLLSARGGTDPDSRLFEAAREFGFEALTKEERRARRSNERGALTAVYPAGLLLESRPRARWQPMPGVDEYEVAFMKDGRALWRRKTHGASLDYPADAPPLEAGHRYVWEVSYSGTVFGEDSAHRTFTVASGSRRTAFDETWRAIETTAPADLVDVLKAHYALREKAYAKAETAARAFLEANPGDEIARETLFQVLEALGSSEADDLREGEG